LNYLNDVNSIIYEDQDSLIKLNNLDISQDQ